MNIHHHISSELLNLPAQRIHELLPGPTLFSLPGIQQRPLFVTVLQHGNEFSGWEAMRYLLRDFIDRNLPRRLYLLISNVAAAQHSMRHLNQQPDYNRIWPGAGCDNETARLFHEITEFMRTQQPVACIDIHNNTGYNPLYSVINDNSAATLRLASDFAPMAVYTHYPKGTQSGAFSQFCPSVSLECGQAGDLEGIAQARHLVETYLQAELPAPAEMKPLTLYRMRARIQVPNHIEVKPLPDAGELSLAADLDRHNFQVLPTATVLGRSQLPLADCLRAEDGDGRIVTEEFFELEDGTLRTKQPIIPGMFTADPSAIRRDCLGYIMEPIN
ncbi:MAG: hypothetical protein Tsb002_38850 [Wenzhouxiangellaceae bacterium]